MPFEINHGLGRFNSKRDLHAALGIPLSAAFGEIRKRYLKIAKTLHPDSRDDESSKKMASDLLSKFVNPAYEVLSQEKEREEYQV
ncbi:MAG: molecular chaperone DnaJ, partial [Cyanobacteria bacterium J003]